MTKPDESETPANTFVDRIPPGQHVVTNDPDDAEPEIVVNGETVGFGPEGMVAALQKMIGGTQDGI